MNEEEVKETLKTMKENIDKKYLKTRNSLAIETVLNLLEKKDKIIDELAEYVASKELLIDKQLNILTSECIKQYFERKVEEE